MTVEEKTERITSHYYCTDPVENFKIKVIIKPIKNLIIPLPENDISQSILNNSTDHYSCTLDTHEEYIFTWQEKVLSNNEIKQYSSQSNWKKAFFEKYCDSYKNCMNFTNSSKRLFSYVDVDDFSEQLNDLDIFKQKQHYFSPLQRKIRILNTSFQNWTNFKNIPKQKLINYHPSEKYKSLTYRIVKNVKKMFIMLELENDTNDEITPSKNQKTEYVLCSISYDTTNKVLEISPSFSHKKPYILNIKEKNVEKSYYYWLYHASDFPLDNSRKEKTLLNLVFNHEKEFKKLQVGTEFVNNKPNHLSVTLLVEIVSAKNFINDSLQIHYFIKLPQGWECEDKNILTGTTQNSFRNSKGVFFFSYIFEVNFHVQLKALEDSFAAFPKIYFEIKSIDKFNRHRSEGYSYVTIPSIPGITNFVLKCWSPLNNTIRSELERFFIGGGSELKDIYYTGPFTFDKLKSTSRCGFQSIPTGELNIKLSTIHQAEIFKMKKVETSDGKYLCNILDTNALLGNINDILLAFRKARERMFLAKKGLEFKI